MSPEQPLWGQRDNPSAAFLRGERGGGGAAHEIKWLQSLPSFLELGLTFTAPHT